MPMLERIAEQRKYRTQKADGMISFNFKMSELENQFILTRDDSEIDFPGGEEELAGKYSI